MYRDNVQRVTHTKHNFVLNHAALGDCITSLPAIIHARRTNPHMEMTLWLPKTQIDLMSLLLFPYGDFYYRPIEEFLSKASERDKEEDGPVTINSFQSNQATRNRMSLVDHAFLPLLDMLPENNIQRSYPTAAPLGRRTIAGPYVVVPVNATSDNKLFHHTVMEPVLKGILERGYKPVLLGKSTTTLKALRDGQLHTITMRTSYDQVAEDVRAQCHDLRDRTTLVQARDICGHASAVVGVDGGTIHLAATTDVPIVYCQTSTRPEHRTIVREGRPDWRCMHVVPVDLACAGCQSNWVLSLRDFSTCEYGDNLCVTSLRPSIILDALDILISEAANES